LIQDGRRDRVLQGFRYDPFRFGGELFHVFLLFVLQGFSPCETRALFTNVNESDQLGYSFGEKEVMGNNNNLKVGSKPCFSLQMENPQI